MEYAQKYNDKLAKTAFICIIVILTIIFSMCLQRNDELNNNDYVTDSFSYPFVQISKPIYYVHDTWANDSVRLGKEIFETKIVIHSCDNVINTLSDDIPNKEYYIESMRYKKRIYEKKLDSLNVENDNLMNSPDRYDTSIDYVKTYMLKF